MRHASSVGLLSAIRNAYKPFLIAADTGRGSLYSVPTMSMNSGDAPLMLSVSGARGIVGRSMTPALASDFAAAFGSFVKASTGMTAPTMCIGRDSRPSGEMLTSAAIAGLVSVGCRVIDVGVLATPTVAVMIGRYRAAGGMAVTASHNPIEWNGIKCLNADGVAPPKRDADEIVRRYRDRAIDYVDVPSLIPIERDDSANQTHVERIIECIDADAIRRAKLKVVLDSVNGGGCVSGRLLLDELGCDVVHINGEPTGRFAHVPEPVKENLTELADRTKAEHAACGFAQDPDADRLAIIDETGRYIGEECTLVLAAMRVLELNGPVVMAANLSTSRMIDDLAERFPGSRVVRTAVGEANVVEAMKSTGASIGGEGNGGVIWPQICWVRDSLSAMALVLSVMASRRQPLSEVVEGLPRYAMVKAKFDLSSLGGREAVDAMIQRVRDHYAEEPINDADGVRIEVTDGWVHLRPSNTEPIVRLIAEAKTDDHASALIEEVTQVAGLASART
jgi:phosphomannomutase